MRDREEAHRERVAVLREQEQPCAPARRDLGRERPDPAREVRPVALDVAGEGDSGARIPAPAEELRELERRRIVEALAATGGATTRAAQLIGMPIRTFTLKLKQYKL